MAPTIYVNRSLAVLFAFFLGLGIGAHALDETMGNPLQTKLSRNQLYFIGFSSLSVAMLIGSYYVITLSLLLLPIMAVELFFAFAYNLEMFRKRFHTTFVFAISWGVIPFLTGYFINSLALSLAPIAMSIGIGLLTGVQRTLSTQARILRRKASALDGLMLRDGTVIPMSSAELARPSEISLKILTVMIFVFAVAFILYRVI